MCENIGVRIRVNDEVGDVFRVKNGSRQGGILSPFLFNFYINEVFDTVSSLSEGCRIGFRSASIFGYADDILLCAPTVTGLRVLIAKTCRILKDLCLPINLDKCLYIIFRRKINEVLNYNIVIEGMTYLPENECTYLGINFSSDLKIVNDVSRCMLSFLRQFNSMFRKFYYMSQNIIIFLFTAYCSSFYASELWLYDSFYLRRLKPISIAYHKAIKRVVNLSPWDSNHVACDMAGMRIFKHLLHHRIISFLFSTLKSNSNCLSDFKYFLRYDSLLMGRVSNVFNKEYNVQNILSNDLDVLRSRIDLVQRTEERSNYSYVPE